MTLTTIAVNCHGELSLRSTGISSSKYFCFFVFKDHHKNKIITKVVLKER